MKNNTDNQNNNKNISNNITNTDRNTEKRYWWWWWWWDKPILPFLLKIETYTNNKNNGTHINKNMQ